jgi:hypothetical protein
LADPIVFPIIFQSDPGTPPRSGLLFDAIADYLIDRPDAGEVIPGAGGARKLRWAAKGKGKRGGARVIYVYVVLAANIYLLRCYAKDVRTDLTADEKKELRQIAAYLKGAH